MVMQLRQQLRCLRLPSRHRRHHSLLRQGRQRWRLRQIGGWTLVATF